MFKIFCDICMKGSEKSYSAYVNSSPRLPYHNFVIFWLCLKELFREYATSSHQLKTEHDMHRKQAELEDRIQQRLKEAEREREMEARKVGHFSAYLA